MYKLLTYMLVVSLVAMMPALAAAGLHQARHGGSHHLGSDHDLPSASSSMGHHHSDEHQGASQHGEHHCCHHNSPSLATSLPMGAWSDPRAHFSLQELPEYRFAPLSHFLCPDLRPPILSLLSV